MKKYVPPILIMYSRSAVIGNARTRVTANFFAVSLKKNPKVCKYKKYYHNFMLTVRKITELHKFTTVVQGGSKPENLKNL